MKAGRLTLVSRVPGILGQTCRGDPAVGGEGSFLSFRGRPAAGALVGKSCCRFWNDAGEADLQSKPTEDGSFNGPHSNPGTLSGPADL